MRKVRARNEHDTEEIEEGVSLWKVPQKITVTTRLASGSDKGENGW